MGYGLLNAKNRENFMQKLLVIFFIIQSMQAMDTAVVPFNSAPAGGSGDDTLAATASPSQSPSDSTTTPPSSPVGVKDLDENFIQTATEFLAYIDRIATPELRAQIAEQAAYIQRTETVASVLQKIRGPVLMLTGIGMGTPPITRVLAPNVTRFIPGIISSLIASNTLTYVCAGLAFLVVAAKGCWTGIRCWWRGLIINKFDPRITALEVAKEHTQAIQEIFENRLDKTVTKEDFHKVMHELAASLREEINTIAAHQTVEIKQLKRESAEKDSGFGKDLSTIIDRMPALQESVLKTRTDVATMLLTIASMEEAYKRLYGELHTKEAPKKKK